jgi:hypothetical protein
VGSASQLAFDGKVDIAEPKAFAWLVPRPINPDAFWRKKPIL